MQAFIGIGSNLENPVAQVQQALEAFATIPKTHMLCCSPLYRSEPLGPPNQPDYINAVARLETELTPDHLLAALQKIENNHGRVRTIRWGPRTLDLDLLLYDDHIQDDPHLTLPHPRMHERAFVLYPLYDIAPDLVIPTHGPIAALLAKCPPLALRKIREP